MSPPGSEQAEQISHGVRVRPYPARMTESNGLTPNHFVSPA